MHGIYLSLIVTFSFFFLTIACRIIDHVNVDRISMLKWTITTQVLLCLYWTEKMKVKWEKICLSSRWLFERFINIFKDRWSRELIPILPFERIETKRAMSTLSIWSVQYDSLVYCNWNGKKDRLWLVHCSFDLLLLPLSHQTRYLIQLWTTGTLVVDWRSKNE